MIEKKGFSSKSLGILLFAFAGMMLFFAPATSDATVRDVPLTIEDAKRYLAENPPEDGVSGLYHLIKGRFHGAYLILPSSGKDAETWEYTATALETSNSFEAHGSVKFFMRKKDGRYVGFYFDSSFTGRAKLRCQFLASPDSITAYIFPSSEPSIFIKGD